MTSAASKSRIRLVFLAVVIGQPLQYAFKVRFGDAYPLLQLPEFRRTMADEGGHIPLDTVEIEASFTDGTTATIPAHILLSQVASAYRQPILNHMFGPIRRDPAGNRGSPHGLRNWLFPGYLAAKHRSEKTDPETKTWLTNRVSELYPSRHAARVTFRWRTDVYDVSVSPTVLTSKPVGVREVDLASR